MLVNEELKFTPLSNYILIDMVKKAKSKIVIPDTVKKPLDGNDFDAIVIAISNEKDKDGNPMVKNVKIGDNVCLAPSSLHTGAVVLLHKKQYFLVRETEVIGLFHEGYDEPIEGEENDESDYAKASSDKSKLTLVN